MLLLVLANTVRSDHGLGAVMDVRQPRHLVLVLAEAVEAIVEDDQYGHGPQDHDDDDSSYRAAVGRRRLDGGVAAEDAVRVAQVRVVDGDQGIGNRLSAVFS